MQIACTMCRSARVTRWFTKRSNDDGRDYPMVRCEACGSAFVLPRPTPEYLEQYYTGLTSSHARELSPSDPGANYQKVLDAERAFPNSVLDGERIVANCHRLASGTRFLDIGAGYGFFSRAARQAGFEVTALEPTEICRGVFREMNGFSPLSGMLTAEFAGAHLGSFDAVLMSQVLEHVVDLEATAGYLASMLAPRGIAAIAVPHFGSWLSRVQGKNDMFVVPPEHLNFFSRVGLEALFRRSGFACRKMHTVSRINTSRVARRIPVAGKAAAQLILAGLRVSDLANGGLFINGYFQKTN